MEWRLKLRRMGSEGKPPDYDALERWTRSRLGALDEVPAQGSAERSLAFGW